MRSDRGEGKHGAAGRADLVFGAHRRADPAVVARRPAAVLDVAAEQRLLPVLPQPLLVQAGVEVVPRQHLGLLALPGGVPVERGRATVEYLRAGLRPAVEREVLTPAVEALAVLPNLADHRADPAITA